MSSGKAKISGWDSGEPGQRLKPHAQMAQSQSHVPDVKLLTFLQHTLVKVAHSRQGSALSS
eukprot:scaffold69787_cov19-Tisochrysis_lutea.AAC.1